jgi:hypothetical protein
MLDIKNVDLAVSPQMLDRKHWPEDFNCQLTFDENEVVKLSIRLKINERATIHGFCEYLIEKGDLENLKI